MYQIDNRFGLLITKARFNICVGPLCHVINWLFQFVQNEKDFMQYKYILEDNCTSNRQTINRQVVQEKWQEKCWAGGQLHQQRFCICCQG